MEKIMTSEERIRRAEELYYKRKNQNDIRVSTNSMNNSKTRKVSLGKKMIIQIIICLLIYLAFFIIKEKNNFFSTNLINETRKFLNYDINFSTIYNNIQEYFSKNFNNMNINNIDNTINNVNEVNIDNLNNVNENNNNNVINENEVEYTEELNSQNEVNNTEELNSENLDNQEKIEENKEIINDINNETVNTVSKSSQEIGIGGGSENCESTTNKTQMELDAEYVKANYSFIIPVKGYITSGFGNRQPTEIISAFHQGIDLGAVIGTPIYASIDGNVVAAGYAGDYGNHIKIQNGEVLTVYAHCSEVNVTVGQYICQGQEIGKVGNTGKVTGAHLHFEIRRENRYIDPQMIINF